MTTAKLRVNLAEGQIEVEGSDDLVREVYADFRDALRQVTTRRSERVLDSAEQETITTSPNPQESVTKRRRKQKSSSKSVGPSVVKDLDLSGAGGNVENLKEFYSSFELKTYMETNLVFIYYLSKKLNVSPITPDHVFTCYRYVGAKVPANLVQSLRDMAYRHGWIDTSNTNDLKLTVVGMNYLEHELPKKR